MTIGKVHGFACPLPLAEQKGKMDETQQSPCKNLKQPDYKKNFDAAMKKAEKRKEAIGGIMGYLKADPTQTKKDCMMDMISHLQDTLQKMHDAGSKKSKQYRSAIEQLQADLDRLTEEVVQVHPTR
jgi:gas vesicle protein